MRPHEGTFYTIDKRVNDGRWMHFSSAPSRESAIALIEKTTKLYAERCPKDRVEFSIMKVH